VLRLTLSDFGIVLWERMVEGKTKAVQLVIICFMGKLLVFGANLLHIDESKAIRFREFKIICLPKSKKKKKSKSTISLGCLKIKR